MMMMIVMVMLMCVSVCVKLSAVGGGSGAGGGEDGEPTSFLGHHHDGDGTSGSSNGGTSSPDSCREADTEALSHEQRDQQMPTAAESIETHHDVVVTPQDLLAGILL